MNKTASQQRPTQRSRQLVGIAKLLGLLLGVLATAFIAFAAQDIRARHQAKLEFQAQVLGQAAAEQLGGTEALLRSLEAALQDKQLLESPTSPDPDFTRIRQRLTDSLQGRPFLKNLAWLDAAGQVLASAKAPDEALGLQSPTLSQAMRAAQDGRAHLAMLPAVREMPKAQLMLMMVELPARRGYVLALLDRSAIAAQFDRQLAGAADGRAALLGANERLAAGNSSAAEAGPSLANWRRLRAQHALPKWPMQIALERDLDTLPSELWLIGRWALAFLLLSWAGLLAGTVIARRALLGDETMRRTLMQAHAATRVSEMRMAAILQSSHDAIVTIDAKGRIIEFNAAAEQMFGYGAATALGQAMDELIVPPALRSQHQAGMAHYRAGGAPRVLGRRIEIEAMRADGTVFPVELTIVPVQTPSGEIFTATLRDISARLQAEQTLRATRSLLDKTGQIGAIGGWEFDVESHELHWTDETLRLHDLEPGQQPSLQGSIEYFAPEVQAQLREAMQLSIARGDGFDLELPLITAKGRRLWVRVVSRAEMDKGVPIRLTGAIQDIDARRRNEAELLAARQRELQVGARIQQTLLVTAPPPQVGGLQISSYSHASQGIDGDFLELIQMGEHCIDLITGDVMGKGLAAAMLGAATKLQFSRSITELLTKSGEPADPLVDKPANRAASRATSAAASATALPSPAAIVSAVHRAMTPALQSLDAFVTLCYLRIDTANNTLTWVGCGHEETLLISGAGEPVALPNQHAPLGVLDDANYVQDERGLAPDDALFLYSDGVTDALQEDGERVGRERVIEAVLRRVRGHATPGAALHSLRRDLLGQGVSLLDDVTMVLVQRQPLHLELARTELPLRLASIRPLREFILRHCLAAGLDDGSCGLLEVAAVEVFTNIVRHGRQLLDEAPVEVLVRRDGAELLIELIHLGAAFEPPTDLPKTDFGAFPEGGFGLSIIAGASDAVDYLHHQGVNTIRLHKSLHKRLQAGR